LTRFELPVRVYYEDTDAAGVVYYAGYLRFMERARTEWLESLGFPLAAFEREQGVTFAVHRAEIDFLKPARLDDRLAVSVLPTPHERRRRALDTAEPAEAGTRDTKPARVGACRLVVGQDVRRDDELLVTARITLACLDAARWRPARIPAPLARVLAPTMARTE
jgi:acyl-CoA thioester hydrolase